MELTLADIGRSHIFGLQYRIVIGGGVGAQEEESEGYRLIFNRIAF